MRQLVTLALLMLLSSCSAVHTSVAKRNLDVQTRMSQTIYLEPVEPELRTIYVDVRQTAAEYQLPLAEDIRALLQSRGYQLLDSPQQAQYWLQVNVRTILKERPEQVLSREEYGLSRDEIDILLDPALGAIPPPAPDTYSGHGTGGFIVDAAVANEVSVDSKDVARALVVLAVFAGAEYVGNQLVQDKYYTMLTDVQVAERLPADSDTQVQENARHSLQQGDSGGFEQLWQRTTDRRKYQVRVVSFANKANLTWLEAEQPLHQGLLRSLSGIF